MPSCEPGKYSSHRCQARSQEFIALVDTQRDDAAVQRMVELGQLALL